MSKKIAYWYYLWNLKRGIGLFKRNLIDSDGNLFLIVDCIKKNKYITGSNNITLRKVDVSHTDLIECILTKDLLIIISYNWQIRKRS